MDREVKQRFYNSKDWKYLRDYILYIEPYCRKCLNDKGKLVLATEVDHIIDIDDNEDLMLDINNLQPLCKSCHSSKTLSKTLKEKNIPNEKKKQKRGDVVKQWKIKIITPVFEQMKGDEDLRTS